MKILLIIDSLASGGAQRVISTMANYWAEKGEEVHLAIIYKNEIFYSLHKNVIVHQLGFEYGFNGKIKGLLRIFKISREIRKLMKEQSPAAAISFLPRVNISSIIAKIGTKVPLIISERSDPNFQTNISRIDKILMKILYPLADGMVLQTEYVKKYFAKYKTKKFVISNPMRNFDRQYISQQKYQNIIAVGRLGKEKGFDTLIRAFSLVKNNEWKLFIYGQDHGDGKYRKYLEEIVKKNSLEQKVFLPGTIENISDKYCDSSIFVLSSRYEGYPNVLMEAMTHGLACVATNIPAGVPEMIIDGENGIIVPVDNELKLAKTIEKLINDEKLRRKLGENAQNIIKTQNLDVIMKKWEKAIEEIKNG